VAELAELRTAAKSLFKNPWLGRETGHNNEFWDRFYLDRF
jgi:hypothetical protein